MSIKERLSQTIKDAMKSGNKEILSFGRNLHAAIRKKEIDDRVDCDDGAVQKIISTALKQRQDSIEQFKAGQRMDLVAKEEAELNFLLSFMPQQLSETEITVLVEAAIEEVKPAAPKDLGAVMKVLMPKTQGVADGKLVSQIVKQKMDQLFAK